MVFVILIIGLVIVYSYFGALGVSIFILVFLFLAYFSKKKETEKVDSNATINFDDNIDYEQLIIDSFNGEFSSINKKIKFGENTFEISPNSRYIAVDNPIKNRDGSEKNHTIDIYEIHTSTLIRKFEIKDRYLSIKSISFCPNAKYLLISTYKELLFFDLNTTLIEKRLKIINDTEREGSIYKTKFSSKGNYVIVDLSGIGKNNILVIDINNESIVKKFTETNFLFQIILDDKYFIYKDEFDYIVKEKIYGEIEQKFDDGNFNSITADLSFFFGIYHNQISIYDRTNYKWDTPDFSVIISQNKDEYYLFRNSFSSKYGDYLVITCYDSSYKVVVLDMKYKTVIANINYSLDKINYYKLSSKGRLLIDSIRYGSSVAADSYENLRIQIIY